MLTIHSRLFFPSVMGLLAAGTCSAAFSAENAGDLLESPHLTADTLLDAEQLSELRGTMLKLSFTLEDKVVINGVVVSHELFTVPGIDPVSRHEFLQMQIAELGLDMPDMAEMDPTVLTDGLVTVIQNALDNQDIGHTRTVHLELADVGSLSNFPLIHSLYDQASLAVAQAQ